MNVMDEFIQRFLVLGIFRYERTFFFQRQNAITYEIPQSRIPFTLP